MVKLNKRSIEDKEKEEKVMKIKKRNVIGIIIIGIVLMNTVGSFSKPKNKLIVVDAGHGGQDPGTISARGVMEKDLNLEIALRLKKKLRKSGYKVVMIREDDDYIDNKERARIANNLMADLYISIHCNAVENNSDINGVQVLYYPKEENIQLASLIQNSVLNYTSANDKGIVAREDLIVLNQTTMPAYIVETGFLTNDNESRLLEDSLYQSKLVKGIVKAIDDINR